jgi:hypothetical protein
MILKLLEICVIGSFAVYFGSWIITVRRRRARAWDMLVAQLRPTRTYVPRELSHESSWDDDKNAKLKEMWRRVQGATGLWEMYVNAGVMLDMADYATRNSDSVDCELLAALHRDAIQIRVCVLTTLAKHACSQVNESTCVKVSRATEYYADMLARMAELIRVNSGALAPKLAGSM